MENKITIIGMEIILGNISGLDAFDFSIYNGTIQEQPWSLNIQDNFEKIISGVLKNTKSDNLLQTGLLLINDANVEIPENYDFNYFNQKNNVLDALEEAQNLLNKDKVNSIILACISDKQMQAGAVRLKLLKNARQDNDRIYGIIDSILKTPLDSSEVDYLEISGIGLENFLDNSYDAANIKMNKDKYSCALGTIKSISANISENTAFIASIIKTALCLYHRYIPGNLTWQTPENLEDWEKTNFYIPTSSKTWFLNKQVLKRKAGILFCTDNSSFNMILSEDETLAFRAGRYLAESVPYCFPLAGLDENDLISQLNNLSILIKSEDNIKNLAAKNFSIYKNKIDAPYGLMITGQSKQELVKEIQFISKQIPSAFAQKSECKTPKGSYFTANPLGKKGKIVFVYPGVGSAYLGLGQDLFHMFPGVYDQFAMLAPNMGILLKEKELYPRTCFVPSEDELKTMERSLRKDIMAISECGISFSVIYTMIMAGYFQLFPDCAMGYSMGEASMMASLMVWKDPGQLSGKLKNNNSFTRGLHGELSAVRESWGLPSIEKGGEKYIWESFTLLEDRHKVSKMVENEERVYLTLINTDNEVVIAGDPQSCIGIAEKLGCQYFPLRLDLAIHSKPAWSEYDNLVDLYSLELGQKSNIKFYSSSCYMPVPIRSKAVANSIARAFCDPVDLPRLVRKIHDDGGRIFVEIGPRQICSLWISNILQGQEFAAIPLNIKGVKDQISITRALAQLVSHRVNIDISPMFKFGKNL